MHKSLLIYPELFFVARTVFYIDDRSPLPFQYVSDSIYFFCQSNPSYKTHGQFDIYEALSDFITSTHLNLMRMEKKNPNLFANPTKIQSSENYNNTVKSLSTSSEAGQAESSMFNEYSSTSPFFSSISGCVENLMVCESCGNEEIFKENFMSLNFKTLTNDQVKQVRKRFEEEGYQEGLITRFTQSQSRAWSLFNIFTKKNSTEPVLTIRDYLCYMNLVQTHQVDRHCLQCKKEQSFTVSKLLFRAPDILIVGFFDGGDSPLCKKPLAYKVDLEFDISPFVNKIQPKYELVSAVTVEVGPIGIRSEVIYTKGPDEKWLRIDQ